MRTNLVRGAAAVLGVVIPLALLPSLGLQAIFWGRAAAGVLFSIIGVGLMLAYSPAPPTPALGKSTEPY